MKSLILFLLLAPSSTALADCILTEYPFSVVCSGYDPTAAAPPSKKNIRTSTKMSKQIKKAGVDDSNGITSAIGMTEEELEFMQARNNQDGYRGKPKHKEQTAKE